MNEVEDEVLEEGGLGFSSSRTTSIFFREVFLLVQWSKIFHQLD